MSDKPRKVSAFIDSENQVWKRIDEEGKTEYEQIKPLVGCIAIYESCPMAHPVRDITPEDLHKYIYGRSNLNDR